MAILETIGLILTSETAGSVAKFLYEKVEGYIREKLKGNKSSEVENLRNQVKDLKDKLASKEKSSESEVEELKQTIQKIEQTNTVPAEIISVDIFKKWSESNELDLVAQAILVKRQLEILYDKALEIGVNDKKRYQIQSKIAIIGQQSELFRDAQSKAADTGSRDDEQERDRIDRLLRENLIRARDLLRGY